MCMPKMIPVFFSGCGIFSGVKRMPVFLFGMWLWNGGGIGSSRAAFCSRYCVVYHNVYIYAKNDPSFFSG